MWVTFILPNWSKFYFGSITLLLDLYTLHPAESLNICSFDRHSTLISRFQLLRTFWQTDKGTWSLTLHIKEKSILKYFRSQNVWRYAFPFHHLSTEALTDKPWRLPSPIIKLVVENLERNNQWDASLLTTTPKIPISILMWNYECKKKLSILSNISMISQLSILINMYLIVVQNLKRLPLTWKTSWLPTNKAEKLSTFQLENNFKTKSNERGVNENDESSVKVVLYFSVGKRRSGACRRIRKSMKEFCLNVK